MSDDRFAEQLGALIREIDPPPATPREAIWAQIDAARRGDRLAADRSSQPEEAGRPAAIDGLQPSRRPMDSSPRAGRGGEGGPAGALNSTADMRSFPQRGKVRRGVAAPPHLRPGRWARHARWAAPLAAALLIGIGIGRVFGPAQLGQTPEATRVAETAGASTPNLPYRLVAAEHLDAAEALLSALPHDARRGDVDAVSTWAEELLVTTRLLLDSPAADEPYMSTLLQDLELVLAQIAIMPATRAEDEVELIEEGIRQNHVLLRVRAATMLRPAAGI